MLDDDADDVAMVEASLLLLLKISFLITLLAALETAAPLLLKDVMTRTVLDDGKLLDDVADE